MFSALGLQISNCLRPKCKYQTYQICREAVFVDALLAKAVKLFVIKKSFDTSFTLWFVKYKNFNFSITSITIVSVLDNAK